MTKSLPPTKLCPFSRSSKPDFDSKGHPNRGGMGVFRQNYSYEFRLDIQE